MQQYLKDYMGEYTKKGFSIYVYGDVVKNILLYHASDDNSFKDVKHTFISDAPYSFTDKINNKTFQKNEVMNKYNTDVKLVNELSLSKLLEHGTKFFDFVAMDIDENIYNLKADK